MDGPSKQPNSVRATPGKDSAMRSYRLLVLLGLFMALSSVFPGSRALAATPGFTLAATNVTMSSSGSAGSGASSFTLTSVNGYTGTVGILCGAPTPPAGVKVPVCTGGGPAILIIETLAANQVVSGTIGFNNSVAPCNPCPVNLPRRPDHGLGQGVELAGALLFAFGFRRRAARWLTLAFFAVGALAVLAGISACGGNNNGATPGTYAYTITAMDITTDATVSTSINVTVP
jgi:hypothetical protein